MSVRLGETLEARQRKRNVYLLLFLAPVLSCTPGSEQTARVICGFADVLIAETDLSLINEAFGGDDAVGTKACIAVRAYLGDSSPGLGEQEPIIVETPTAAEIELPDGKNVNVVIEPPT